MMARSELESGFVFVSPYKSSADMFGRLSTTFIGRGTFESARSDEFVKKALTSAVALCAQLVLPVNYSLTWGFTLFGQTRIDILGQPRSSDMRLQWQNPIGLSRTLIGNLSAYAEFYSAVSTGHNQPWVGTLDTGLIYQVTPNFSIDVNGLVLPTDGQRPITVCSAVLATAFDSSDLPVGGAMIFLLVRSGIGPKAFALGQKADSLVDL